MQTFKLFTFAVFIGLVFSAPAEDEVVDLPGLDYPINFKHYSGYLDGGDGRFLHYWFTESQRNPAEDPVLLWLNGGPGCSSLDGLLSELGPFHVLADGSGLYENKDAWNTFANVIFLESPVCVGFSYEINNNCAASDDKTALQNYLALQDFFLNKFPEYRNNEFFITGESYGGIYIPTLSLKVVEGLSDFYLNFQGFAIGNGMLSYQSNSNSLMFFGNYHSLLGSSLWNNMVKHCCGGVESPDNCDFFLNMTALCEANVLKAEKIMYYSGLNMYNLYGECLHPDSGIKSSSVSRDQIDIKNLRFRPGKTSGPEPRMDPTCTDASNIRTWINDPAVRQALHIPPTVNDWDICSSAVSTLYRRQYFNMHDSLMALNDYKIRGLVYNGDVDMACNGIGNMWDVHGLKLDLVEKWQKWMVPDEQVGGYYEKFVNLDFVTIRGAGHMVPTDKAAPALQMIQAFVEQTPYSVV